MHTLHRAQAQVFSPDGKNKLHYWTLGNPQYETILILPGFTGTHKDLLPFARALEQNFFVIIPDLPGWGASRDFTADFTLTNYGLYLKLLLDHLQIQKVDIIGHCMGAVVGIELAYQFPEKVKKLFLVSTPYDQETLHHVFFMHLANWSRRAPHIIRPLFFLWRNRVVGFFISFIVLKFKTFRKTFRLTMRKMREQPLENEEVVEENWISLMNFDYEKVRSLKMPVHFFHGAQDVLIPAHLVDNLLKQISQATFELVPHSGHLPPVETPQTLAHQILKYL